MVLAFISDASHLNHFVMHPLQMRPKMRFPLKRSALTTAKVRTVKVFRNTDPVNILHVFGSRIFCQECFSTPKHFTLELFSADWVFGCDVLP